MLQEARDSAEALTSSDQRRVNSVILLRRAIRHLLMKSLQERSFADILADRELVRQHYPVYKDGNLI